MSNMSRARATLSVMALMSDGLPAPLFYFYASAQRNVAQWLEACVGACVRCLWVVDVHVPKTL